MVEYRVSLGCNFLLANAIGLFSPALSSWRRTAIGGIGIGAVIIEYGIGAVILQFGLM